LEGTLSITLGTVVIDGYDVAHCDAPELLGLDDDIVAPTGSDGLGADENRSFCGMTDGHAHGKNQKIEKPFHGLLS